MENLYVLLTFEGSDRCYVRKYKDIKEIDGATVTKWHGGSYNVRILAKHKEKIFLKNLADNINNGWPTVSLPKYSKFVIPALKDSLNVQLTKTVASTPPTTPPSIPSPEKMLSTHFSPSPQLDSTVPMNLVTVLSCTSSETILDPSISSLQEMEVARNANVGLLQTINGIGNDELHDNFDQGFLDYTGIYPPVSDVEDQSVLHSNQPTNSWGDSNHIQTEFELQTSSNLTELRLETHSQENPSANVDDKLCTDSNISESAFDNQGDSTIVKTSKTGIHKIHSCLYCGIKTVTLPRHLQRKHIEEADVKKAYGYGRNSVERRNLLEQIRKQGDYEYNKTNPETTIVTRESTKPYHTSYIPCVHCNGYYSIKNIRHHIRKYCSGNKNNKRNISKLGIVRGAFIHESASDLLKDYVFPSIRNIKILKFLMSDETAVLYGNSIARLYINISLHNVKMVTAEMRLLGNSFLVMQEKDSSIEQLKDVFHPTKYEILLEAVKVLAKFNGRYFDSPTVAQHCCILYKKVGGFVKSQKIKENDHQGQKDVENFIYLLQFHQNFDMTKGASESRAKKQRSKVELIPTTGEINYLISSLEADITINLNELKKGFNDKVWVNLSKLILVYIMVFNRKRPGDVQRTEIIEYKTIQTINENSCSNLSKHQKEHASNFARYVSRGKLNKNSSVLLSIKVRDAIDALLTLRTEAQISSSNNYLFAAPFSTLGYYEADKALKEYCSNKGIPHGKFTATKLRKHLATNTALLSNDKQSVISEFMGHSQHIHNNIYKQRDAYVDIMIMGQVLTDASGFTNASFPCNIPSTQQSSSQPPQWVDDSSESEPELANLATNVKGKRDLSLIIEENDDSTDISDKGASTCNNVVSFVQRPTTTATPMNDYVTPVRRGLVTPTEQCITSPSINVGSRTWATPERTMLRECFRDYFNRGEVPDLNIIQEEKLSGKLKPVSRSIQQIQAWIREEIKRKQKGKKGWSTPQKLKCREYFKDFYCSKTKQKYPTTLELQEAIEVVPEFHEKTIQTLRSHLQHDFKYIARRSK